MIAGIGWATSDAIVFALFVALLALGNSAGKTLFLEVFEASIIVRELLIEIVDCVP